MSKDKSKDDGTYTARCSTCGFETNKYGKQEIADSALEVHKKHYGH